MKVVLLTGDLMVMARVQGVATRIGAELETLSSADQAAGLFGDIAVDLLIVDLSLPSIDFDELIPAVKTARKVPSTIVAFGPHVHETKLAAARKAGCDSVISRGEFFGRIDDVFAGRLP